MNQRQHKVTRQDNLKRLLEPRGAQVKLSELLDCSPSFISQLINGHRDIGDDVAEKIESALNLPNGALDVPMGEMEDDRAGATRNLINDTADYYDDLVKVPSYFAFAGAGGGMANQEELQVPGGFTFKRKSLAKAGLIGKKLSCIFAKGQSMQPTLGDGDLLLLDHDIDRIDDGLIYAFIWGDDLRCKRLFKRADGQITIRSDNPNKFQYPDETVQPDEPGFSVVARIRWRGGWL